MVINIIKKESNLRVLLGVWVITAGSSFLSFLSLPLAAMLISSGLTSKCTISHLLGRQTEAAKQQLFLNYQPKYNPQPIFIFKANYQLAFAPANALFANVYRYQDLINSEIASIIQKEIVYTMGEIGEIMSISRRLLTEKQGAQIT